MEQRQQIWVVSGVGLVSNALGLSPGPAVEELVTWVNLLISSSLSFFHLDKELVGEVTGAGSLPGSTESEPRGSCWAPG